MSGVYIAGPMRGYPGYNFHVFEQAQKTVEAYRHLFVLGDDFEIDYASEQERVDICNPAMLDILRYDLAGLAAESGWQAAGQWLLDNPQEFDLRKALGEDMEWIAYSADHIVLLPGWQDSKGACAEKALSEALGHQVWYLDATRDLIVREDPYSVPPGGVSVTVPRALTERAEPHPIDVVNSATREALSEAYRSEGIREITREVMGLGEVRTASSTGGEKGVKLARYDLIPVGPLRQLAEHYGRGAAKYADNQWRRGYEFSKSIAAKTRHFEGWRGGEEYDICTGHEDECRHTDMDGNPFEAVPSPHGPTCFNHTGSHHLAADLWHSMFLLEGLEHWPEHDDRFRYPEPTGQVEVTDHDGRVLWSGYTDNEEDVL